MVLARELQGFYVDGERFLYVSVLELSLTKDFPASV